MYTGELGLSNGVIILFKWKERKPENIKANLPLWQKERRWSINADN